MPIVAVDEGLVVGMALGEPGRLADGDGPPDRSLLHVSMVFVAPARWGVGVGRALLDGLFAEARRADYVRATLWTASNNERASRLYVGSGMHPTGCAKVLATYGAVIQFGIELKDNVP
jgi:ribosomal protein S18 acetylase RimI-like enzyme